MAGQYPNGYVYPIPAGYAYPRSFLAPVLRVPFVPIGHTGTVVATPVNSYAPRGSPTAIVQAPRPAVAPPYIVQAQVSAPVPAPAPAPIPTGWPPIVYRPVAYANPAPPPATPAEPAPVLLTAEDVNVDRLLWEDRLARQQVELLTGRRPVSPTDYGYGDIHGRRFRLPGM